jgi:sporulation protein YlmC with PRC-barrel domain
MYGPGLLTAALLLAGAPAVQAQDAAPASVPQNAFSATELVGRDELDVEGAKVGEVADTVVDQDQRVEAVVVEVGGFLGIGAKPVRLDASNLQTDGGDTIRVGLSATQLEELPPAD